MSVITDADADIDIGGAATVEEGFSASRGSARARSTADPDAGPIGAAHHRPMVSWAPGDYW